MERGEKGATAVEFLVVGMTLVIPLCFAMFFTAQILWIWHSVAEMTREGARYAATHCYQNGTNKLIAAPFCVRAKPGAPVSMPLVWSEVKKGLTPNQFTIRNAIARLEKRGDPMAPLLTLKPALKDALGRLLS